MLTNNELSLCESIGVTYYSYIQWHMPISGAPLAPTWFDSGNEFWYYIGETKMRLLPKKQELYKWLH